MEIEAGSNIPPVKIYPDKFAGHIVVVTGAGSGIGATTARLFAEQGAHVVLIDITADKLQQVNSSILAKGEKASFRVCDLTSEDAVSQTIDWVIATWGKIDVVAHIAGIYPFHALEGYPTDKYRAAMAVNVDSAFFLTRTVTPHMRAAGYGRIIHTCSSTVQEPEVGLTAYVASKAAIIGLVRSAAGEAGPGITVNAVMPGLIKTEAAWAAGMRADGTNSLFETVVQKQVVKRWGRPEDIAHSFCFVASPEASFFTGQIFNCSGGETFI